MIRLTRRRDGLHVAHERLPWAQHRSLHGGQMAGTGLGIALLGPCSGGSINPTRQFGPVAFAGQTTDLRICLAAPILGAALGAWLHHLLSSRRLTREVRVRASGESPDGRVAAVGVSRRPVGCTQAPTRVPPERL
jgi:hypothetical protein